MRRGSVSSRRRFNMQKGSFESGRELGNQPKILVVLDGPLASPDLTAVVKGEPLMAVPSTLTATLYAPLSVGVYLTRNLPPLPV